MYGQLLQRMGPKDDPSVSYAVVVPDTAWHAAERVPRWVTGRLRIDIYTVSTDGQVTLASP